MHSIVAIAGLAVLALIALSATATPTTPPIYVATMFRHGHRAPIDASPRSAAAWAATGYQSGQLTQIGMAMHRAWGQKLRSTYLIGSGSGSSLAYLPYNYTYQNLNVRSTDVDRCLMSVTIALGQLYPGVPFPIHTVPVADEWLLQMVDHNPAYNIENAMWDRKWDQILSQSNYSQLIGSILSWTGYNSNQFDYSNLMWNTYDNWQCGSYIGIPLDNPYLKDHFSVFWNVTQYISADQYGMTNGVNDPRGTVGWPLMAELLSQFNAHATASPTPQPLMSLYSAHDTTLVALWSALGYLTPDSFMNSPAFAQSVTFELRPPSNLPPNQAPTASDYILNLKVGAPRALDASNMNFAYDMWDYPIPCGGDTVVYNCTLGNFTNYVSQFYKPDGWCLRTDQFQLQGCDNYTAPTSTLPAVCQLYRHWCPVQSCDHGQVLNSYLDPTQQWCQDMINTELSQDQRAMWLAIGGGIMAGVFMIGLLVYCACWKERRGRDRNRSRDSAILPVPGSDVPKDVTYAALSPDAIGASPAANVNH